MDERVKIILIGLILGDGYLTPCYGQSHRSKLDMKGDNKNLSYLKWLHGELQSLGPSELKPKKGYHQHRFYTATNDGIGDLRELFYRNGKKIIPENITEILTDPLSIAVWYQDDGSLDYRSKYHFNSVFATHCFSFNECKLLVKTLEQNFGLDVRVSKCTMRGFLRYKLYVTSGSMERFIQIIEPFVRSCFAYKIRKPFSQQPR